ncbi:TatD family hydrolase, partial [Halalkalibacter lacteus]|uniref:TatD family hydrolase n=1 Tax=Halalkalibacter lacteus TaxID=3090663 RepID=UPI002FC94A39
LETDSPYLSPVPFRGKRNEPAYLSYVVQKLSELKGMGRADIENITTANAYRIFSIPKQDS